MIEVKVKGDWPETAIQDMKEIRSKIDEFNLDSPRILLIGPRHLLNNLDMQSSEEPDFTYMRLLQKKEIIDGNIRWSSNDKFAILYAYVINHNLFPKITFDDTASVKIIGIRSIRNQIMQAITCAGCGKETEVPFGDQDGNYFKWSKCECGHETEIKSLREG